MTTPSFDTKDGIEEYLKRGLAGLHDLHKDRYAHYVETEQMPLNKWVVLGYLVLAESGGVDEIVEGAPKDHYRFSAYYADQVKLAMAKNAFYHFPRVMTFADAYRFSASLAYTSLHLPPADAICQRCEHGWTLDDVRDVAWVYVAPRERRVMHKQCVAYQSAEIEHRDFTTAFVDAQLGPLTMRAIPNEYWPQSLQQEFAGSPWYMVDTTWGTFKIGWRKRVIVLDWSRLDAQKRERITQADLFKDEETTKGPVDIHCWGYAKLTDYLKRIRAATGGTK